MAVVDIDFIHGDMLVRNVDESLPSNIDGLYPVNNVVARYPLTHTVDLVARQASLYYVVTGPDSTILLDANSGTKVSPLTRHQVESLARHYYAGKGSLIGVQLLTDIESKPKEIQARPLPLWRADFEDKIATTFYISPATGELVTRRHSFWRAYDFLWMLHIMDYEDRANFNNNLLRVAAALGLITAFTGVWLLIYSLRGSKQTDKSAKATTAAGDPIYDTRP